MTEAGITYGSALYALAREEQLSEAIHGELTALQESFLAEPDFCRLLSNPALTKDQRRQILDDSFRGKLHPYVLNFLKLLTEKGYIRCFGDCCQAYTEQYHADNGILSVTAVTAVALSPAQEQALKDRLGAITGKQILLRSRIDPAVLGGVRLSYSGRCLDDTVSHRLESLKALLEKTVL